MSNEKQKPLVVNIADKVFKIKVDFKNEEHFLNMIKLINLKLKEYKTNYPGLYLQEYLSMVLIWLAGEKAQEIESSDPQFNHNEKLMEDMKQYLNHWEKLIELKNEK